MNCLKCGRETDQTFCEHCRETMEKYPVKPGSFAVLPKRNRVSKRVPQRRDPISPEMQITKLRRVIRRMSAAILVLVLLLGAMGYIVYRLWVAQDSRPVGQNYSTVTKPVEEEETAETTQSE